MTALLETVSICEHSGTRVTAPFSQRDDVQPSRGPNNEPFSKKFETSKFFLHYTASFIIHTKARILTLCNFLESKRRGPPQEEQVAVFRDDSRGSKSVSCTDRPFLSRVVCSWQQHQKQQQSNSLRLVAQLFPPILRVKDAKDERNVGTEDETLQITTIEEVDEGRVDDNEYEAVLPAVRTPSVRWKQSHNAVEDEPAVIHEPLPNVLPRGSSLKSSAFEAVVKVSGYNLSSEPLSSRNSSRSAFNSQNLVTSPSTVTSFSSFGCNETALPTGKMHGHGTVSLSLEDLTLARDSPLHSHYSRVGMMKRNVRSIVKNETARTWSFDDLTLIKRLNAGQTVPCSPNELARMELMPNSTSPRASAILHSPHRSHLIDNLRLESMSKEDIVSLWHASERELLSDLNQIRQQKRALEEKVALLQRMLHKPP